MVNEVLCDIVSRYVYIYLDNILIFTRTLEEHILHGLRVIHCLLENQLNMKAERCELHRSAIQFPSC